MAHAPAWLNSAQQFAEQSRTRNTVWKLHIRRTLAEGQLPLWNPQIFTGLPFLAAGQASTPLPAKSALLFSATRRCLWLVYGLADCAGGHEHVRAGAGLAPAAIGSAL